MVRTALVVVVLHCGEGRAFFVVSRSMAKAKTKSKRAEKKSSGDPEYASAARLAKLRTILESGAAAHVDDLAERLGITTRSIFRYLKLLSLTESLVEDEVEGRKCWRIERGQKRSVVRLTTTQLVALRLALGQMRALAGTGLHEDLVAVCEELEATLRGADHAHARSLDKKLFDVGEAPYDYDDRADDIDAIVTALLKEERLQVTHAGSRGPRTFRVEPYTLMVYRRGLYLVGYSEDHAAMRKFGLDALSGVEWLKGDRFAYPADYDPSQLVDGAFGVIQGERTRVKLRFSAKVARYVARRRWHPTLAIARGDDGALEATMDVAGTDELKAWVLSFGSECEVVEPRRLREEIAGTLAQALAKYGA